MTDERRAVAPTPVWVVPVLLMGAALMLYWAWFIIGFQSEPSAVGRIWLVLVTSSAYSAGWAVVGVIGAVGLMRRERWARTLATIELVAACSDRGELEQALATEQADDPGDQLSAIPACGAASEKG